MVFRTTKLGAEYDTGRTHVLRDRSITARAAIPVYPRSLECRRQGTCHLPVNFHATSSKPAFITPPPKYCHNDN